MTGVLIVDDEINIRAGLREVLATEGFHIKEAENSGAALKVLENWSCDVVVLDIRMPGIDGIDLLEVIRKRWPSISVVMLTGHGTLESAMAALKKGAQDYLLKPAKPGDIRLAVQKAAQQARRKRESSRLIDSLRSGLSRLEAEEGAAAQQASTLSDQTDRIRSIGSMTVDFGRREVLINAQRVSLSPTEYALIQALASSPSLTLNYQELARIGLGYDVDKGEAIQLVKRHIFAIRKKLIEGSASRHLIQNIRSFGYRLSAE